MDRVELQIGDLHWLDPASEEEDLCLHGSFYVKIGEEVVSDGTDPTWTISASVLFLFRTLENGHTPEKPVSENLIPCCGFSMYKQEESEDCLVIECPNGINWTVEKKKNSFLLITENQISEEVSFRKWRDSILRLAEEIEEIYRISKSKRILEEEKEGYDTFWVEWNRRKQAATSIG